jgi:hypothetical protein
VFGKYEQCICRSVFRENGAGGEHAGEQKEGSEKKFHNPKAYAVAV